MKTQIIYSSSVIGHNLEYLHHIYEVCLSKKHLNFVFLVPCSFLKYKNRFYWEESNNIIFEFIPEEQLTKKQNSSIFLRSIYLCKILKKCFKRHSTNRAFSTNIIELLPWAPFILKKARISGIMYILSYFYHSDYSSIKLLKSKLINRILIKSSIFNKILLLNDHIIPQTLNNRNNYNRFIALADPLPPNPSGKIINLRESLGISADKKIFLHIGGLGIRKGTLDIIDSFNYIPKDIIQTYCFLFIGRISQSIKEIFTKKINYWKSKGLQIIVEDGGYCSYERFYSMCNTSDVILIPYKNVYQSSGVLGFAAYAKKPVIGPDKGLLANLISNYQLGICIDTTPENLSKTYEKAVAFKVNTDKAQNYLIANSLYSFKQTIYNML
ncbi:MAG: glycosyltransferase [Bacteroides sp.]|nr:glycosyltransferase [Bacteroides sp.]